MLPRYHGFSDSGTQVKEGATNMIEEIDKGMDQLKEQYIEPYVNQRKSSKGKLNV